MTAEPATDEIAARAIRDARFDVNRVSFSWAVRIGGGKEVALGITHDEVMQQRIPAFNGPGRCWFAVHGDGVDALLVEQYPDYDACMDRLEELERTSPHPDPASYALRADDMPDALRLIRQNLMRPFVTSCLAGGHSAVDEKQTNEQRRAALPLDVLLKAHDHMHRRLIELTADCYGWDDTRAEDHVNDDLNDLIGSLLAEQADAGRAC